MVSYDQIRKVFPKFKIPEQVAETFGARLVNPILTQRVCEGLHLCGVRDQHLQQNPHMVSHFYQIA